MFEIDTMSNKIPQINSLGINSLGKVCFSFLFVLATQPLLSHKAIADTVYYKLLKSQFKEEVSKIKNQEKETAIENLETNFLGKDTFELSNFPKLFLDTLQVPPLGKTSLYFPSEYLVPSTSAEIVSDNQLLLDLSDRRVYVYKNGSPRVSYPVAVGKEGWETPTGVFSVRNMEYHPKWKHPWTGEVVPAGEDNPLGVAWIGFWSDGKNQIGFHGTPNPSVIGEAVSHGCVRMHNENILELYQTTEVGMTVQVVQ